MSKFHINKHGVPAPCKAKSGNCPLGGEESHFESKEEAQVQADKQNGAEHGILPGINTNDNKEEKFDNKLEELDKFVESESPKYLKTEYETPDVSDTEMYQQVDKYVDAVINKHEGKEVDLEKTSSDLGNQWNKDVEENAESYYESEDGGQNEKWTSSSEDAQEEDFKKAADSEESFHERVELVDATYKKVNEINWKEYGKTQKDGVSEAMYALKNSFNE